MKFLLTSYLPALTFASLFEMQKMLNILGNNTKVNPRNQRSQLSQGVLNLSRDIWNYGCWCYFQENHGKGRGEPQNWVDEHCKVLHHGYSCVMIDADNEASNCDPFTQEYETISILGAVPENVHIDCEARNPNNDCASRSCAVESFFVLNFYADYFGDNIFDPSLKHDLGWDTSVCRNSNPEYGNGRPSTCCGSYPPRFPYRSGNGRRECCGEKTYDTTIYSCCSNDTIKPSC